MPLFRAPSAACIPIRCAARIVIHRRRSTVAGAGFVLVLLQGSRHRPRRPVLPSELPAEAVTTCTAAKPRYIATGRVLRTRTPVAKERHWIPSALPWLRHCWLRDQMVYSGAPAEAGDGPNMLIDGARRLSVRAALVTPL